MGDFAIQIRGTGPHHNTANPEDVDRMAARFVQQLRDAGHLVRDAAITTGGETRLVNERYVELGDAQAPPSPGRLAFNAYRAFRGGKNHDGTETPTWEQLTPEIRQAWEVASAAARTLP